jgi:recombination associated protein RdgC
LQDPRQQQRSVRIQRQELSANYVQALLKNNLEVSQMKMTWSDQITFILKNDFSLQSLQYKDSEVELSSEEKIDTKAGSFRANFFIMSGILSKMFAEFLKIFTKTADN